MKWYNEPQEVGWQVTTNIPSLLDEIKSRQHTAGRQYAAAMLDISLNIYKLRKKRGMTQAELGEKARLPQSRVSDLERPISDNAPSLKTLSRLAEALGVTIVDLISKR